MPAPHWFFRFMYDRESAAWERQLDEPEHRELVEHTADELANVVAPPGPVADLGCGPGHVHALALAQRGYDVVGVDGSPRMVEVARIRAASDEVDATFNVYNVSAPLRFADASLGGVLAILVLQHLPHPAAFIAEIRRCLRPGGHLLITAPARDRTSLTSQNRYWRLRAACYRLVPGVVRFYDTSSLSRLVEDQGLTVVECNGEPGRVQRAGSSSGTRVTESAPVVGGPAGTSPGGTPWQDATVEDIAVETRRAKTFQLRLSNPSSRVAGQHYVVRLTAPDGYRTQRSYSVASSPTDPSRIELTVERLEDGEVSSFLHDVVEIGDELEVRGPIGGFFVWEDGPALLLGGGSGLVPLMSMLRLARTTGRSDQIRLVQSVRDPDELLYRDELPGPEVTVVHSRVAPPGSARPAGRITAADIAPLVRDDQVAYVCGSAGFAGTASQLVVDLGIPVDRVRVERFGPSG